MVHVFMFTGLNRRKPGRIKKLHELLMSVKCMISLSSDSPASLFICISSHSAVLPQFLPLFLPDALVCSIPDMSSPSRQRIPPCAEVDKQTPTYIQIRGYYPEVPSMMFNQQTVGVDINHPFGMSCILQ